LPDGTRFGSVLTFGCLSRAIQPKHFLIRNNGVSEHCSNASLFVCPSFQLAGLHSGFFQMIGRPYTLAVG